MGVILGHEIVGMPAWSMSNAIILKLRKIEVLADAVKVLEFIHEMVKA